MSTLPTESDYTPQGYEIAAARRILDCVIERLNLEGVLKDDHLPSGMPVFYPSVAASIIIDERAAQNRNSRAARIEAAARKVVYSHQYIAGKTCGFLESKLVDDLRDALGGGK